MVLDWEWGRNSACADPGTFARGVGGSRPYCQKTALTRFLAYFTVSQWFINGLFKENYSFPWFQRGSNIFQGGSSFSRGGIQLFQGGGV